jgi:hypothetical protein
VSVTWAPSLEQVAVHVPARTRAVAHPGSTAETPVPQGTFNDVTSPTAEEAGRHIAAAVAEVLVRVIVVPASPAHLAGMATTAAALRAAADIELAYGSDRDADRDADPLTARDIDTQIYRELNARAVAAMDALVAAVNTAGGGSSGSLLPQWSFPDPVAWGDTYL